MPDFESYQNPLITRYASAQMSRTWSDQTRHSTWRKLWLALAEAQQQLGLEISDEQLSSLRDATDDIDFEVVAGYERDLRHDVMAHVHAYGDRCPE
ncbi:MAG: adenylosuccinate lyase, partial [Planctomycetaceae bacterium]